MLLIWWPNTVRLNSRISFSGQKDVHYSSSFRTLHETIELLGGNQRTTQNDLTGRNLENF